MMQAWNIVHAMTALIDKGNLDVKFVDDAGTEYEIHTVRKVKDDGGRPYIELKGALPRE